MLQYVADHILRIAEASISVQHRQYQYHHALMAMLMFEKVLMHSNRRLFVGIHSEKEAAKKAEEKAAPLWCPGALAARWGLLEERTHSQRA